MTDREVPAYKSKASNGKAAARTSNTRDAADDDDPATQAMDIEGDDHKATGVRAQAANRQKSKSAVRNDDADADEPAPSRKNASARKAASDGQDETEPVPTVKKHKPQVTNDDDDVEQEPPKKAKARKPQDEEDDAEAVVTVKKMKKVTDNDDENKTRANGKSNSDKDKKGKTEFADGLDDETRDRIKNNFSKVLDANRAANGKIDVDDLWGGATEAVELRQIKADHFFLIPRGKLPKEKPASAKQSGGDKKDVFRYFVNFVYYRGEVPEMDPIPPPPAPKKTAMKDGRKIAVELEDIKWKPAPCPDKQRERILAFEVTGRIGKFGKPKIDSLGRLMVSLDIENVEDVRAGVAVDRRIRDEMWKKLPYMDNMRVIPPQASKTSATKRLLAAAASKKGKAGAKSTKVAEDDDEQSEKQVEEEEMVFIHHKHTTYRSIIKLGKSIDNPDDDDPFEILADENGHLIPRYADRIDAQLVMKKEAGKLVPQFNCIDNDTHKTLNALRDFEPGNRVTMVFQSPYLTYNESEYGPAKHCTMLIRLDQKVMETEGARGQYGVVAKNLRTPKVSKAEASTLEALDDAVANADTSKEATNALATRKKSQVQDLDEPAPPKKSKQQNQPQVADGDDDVEPPANKTKLTAQAAAKKRNQQNNLDDAEPPRKRTKASTDDANGDDAPVTKKKPAHPVEDDVDSEAPVVKKKPARAVEDDADSDAPAKRLVKKKPAAAAEDNGDDDDVPRKVIVKKKTTSSLDDDADASDTNKARKNTRVEADADSDPIKAAQPVARAGNRQEWQGKLDAALNKKAKAAAANADEAE